jgi:hypothetical protein
MGLMRLVPGNEALVPFMASVASWRERRRLKCPVSAVSLCRRAGEQA